MPADPRRRASSQADLATATKSVIVPTQDRLLWFCRRFLNDDSAMFGEVCRAYSNREHRPPAPRPMSPRKKIAK
jgi:hypothetical protein